MNIQESHFVERIYNYLRGTVEFYIDLSWKLRITREDEIAKNNLLIEQNNDFLNAMTAVKQMKSTENLGYYLFGIKRLTEQKYFSIMNAAKNNLKVANHELAFRQVRFLDDFNEFLLNKQKKIEHSEKKIENLEGNAQNLIFLATVRKIQKENKILTSKSNNVTKTSKQLITKQMTEGTNQPDMLNKIFEERYKWALQQKEEAEKTEKQVSPQTY